VSPVYGQISEAIYQNVYEVVRAEKSSLSGARDMQADIQSALD
jgi:hypothetical protein